MTVIHLISSASTSAPRFTAEWTELSIEIHGNKFNPINGKLSENIVEFLNIENCIRVKMDYYYIKGLEHIEKWCINIIQSDTIYFS